MNSLQIQRKPALIQGWIGNLSFQRGSMTAKLSPVLKSLLVGIALTASALALALPAPKDIETAVSQGRLAQAESMLREVIDAKPQSAKAHYELGQVLLRENRPAEAHAELNRAQALDPSLKFASSDQQFKALLERTQSSTLPAHTAGMQGAPQPVAAVSHGFSLTYVWIAIAALGVIALLIRMNRPAAQRSGYAPASTPPAGSPLSTAFGRHPDAGYAPAPPSAGYPGPASSGGSTVAGAVVGGLAGVAAGYALSKALESDHHAMPSSPAPGNNSWADDQGLVSAEPAGSVPEFDPGRGSDWGDDSGAGNDDTW